MKTRSPFTAKGQVCECPKIHSCMWVFVCLYRYDHWEGCLKTDSQNWGVSTYNVMYTVSAKLSCMMLSMPHSDGMQPPPPPQTLLELGS